MTLLLSACSAIATWPPVEGKAVLAPSAPPCPQLMATSITYTRQNTHPQAPLTFNLPPGTGWKVWVEVQRQLGADARMMEPGDTPVFDVRQIRLDGGKADVDVVYRTPDGVWQMATVHFRGSFGGHYRPVYFQHWFIPVDPPTRHTPPPPPPPPPTPPSWPESSAGGSAGDAAGPSGSSTEGSTTGETPQSAPGTGAVNISE